MRNVVTALFEVACAVLTAVAVALWVGVLVGAAAACAAAAAVCALAAWVLEGLPGVVRRAKDGEA